MPFGGKFAWGFGALMSVLLLLVVYQNCGVEKSAPADPNLLNIVVAQEIYSDLAPLCESPSHYNCMKRVFGPDEIDRNYKQEECATIGGQEVCVDVLVHHYSSKSALDNCDDCTKADSEFGGQYHFVEYFCYVDNLVDENKYVFDGEASSLADSLQLANGKCMEWAQQ